MMLLVARHTVIVLLLVAMLVMVIVLSTYYGGRRDHRRSNAEKITSSSSSGVTSAQRFLEEEDSNMVVVLLDTDLNPRPDPNEFVFVKDMFVDGDDQYTAGYYSNDKGQPIIVEGTTTTTGSGGLIVHLGGYNSSIGYNMSAGFRYDFTVDDDEESSPLEVTVQFNYQVLWPYQYENDEESQVLVGIDSDMTYEVDHFDDTSSPFGLSEWRIAIVNVGILESGLHYLDLGGISNYKDHERKRTYLYFDNIIMTGIVVQQTTTALAPTLPPTTLPSSFPTEVPTTPTTGAGVIIGGGTTTTTSPTSLPSSFPTEEPSISQTTFAPTSMPSSFPTEEPSISQTTLAPTTLPSSFPTEEPSMKE